VITGASAGVGRATVREFGTKWRSYRITCAKAPRALTRRDEVEAAGGEAVILPVDVSSTGEVESAARIIEETLGPIDVWINNAMLSVLSPAQEMTAEEFAPSRTSRTWASFAERWPLSDT